jgi:glycosyltransferase involved in cell wall biosynthesis
MLLSVLIPTRNRAQRVSDLLDSLAVQEPVPFDWEVLVIDNGSTDGTNERVRERVSGFPVALCCIREPRPGLHHGRHRGAQEARGEFLAYLDDDTLVTARWWQGVELLQQQGADAVAGRIAPKWEAPVPGWVALFCRDGTCGPLSLLDLGMASREIDPLMVWGANFFLRRGLVFELGGFHPDSMPPESVLFRGDGESGFFQKFKDAGYHAWYAPQALVYHVIGPERLTIEYFCRRFYCQGISASFTQIRNEYGGRKGEDGAAQKVSAQRVGVPPFWARVRTGMGWRLRYLAEKMRSFGSHSPAVTSPAQSEYAHIYSRIMAAHGAGFRYHQDEIRKDPKLLEWVVKGTYWE